MKYSENNISDKRKPVDEDEVIEIVKLKSSVKEEIPCEDNAVEKPREHPETEIKMDEDKPNSEYEMAPLKKFESEPEKTPVEDSDKFEVVPKESKEEKPKRFKKKKAEPLPETTEQLIDLGEPKPKKDTIEDEIDLQYKQKPLTNESTEEVILKPMKKDEKETEQPEVETVHEIRLNKKTDFESPEGKEGSPQIKIKKKKHKVPQGEDEAAMDVVISFKKKLSKKLESDEGDAQFTLANIPLKQHQAENVDAKISLKPKVLTKSADEAAGDLTLTLTPSQPDEEQVEVFVALKQPDRDMKPEDTEGSTIFTIEKPTEVLAPENVSEKLKLEEKKPKKEVAADELSISQEVVIEPQPISVEEIVEDVQIIEKPDHSYVVEYPEEFVEQPEPLGSTVEISEFTEEPKSADGIEESEVVTFKKEKKPKQPEQPTEELVEDVILKEPNDEQPQTETEQSDVVLKPKKFSEKTVEEADHVVFTIEKKTEVPMPEDVSEKLKIKREKSKKQAAADKLSITKKNVIELGPITVEEIVGDIQIVGNPIEEIHEHEFPEKPKEILDKVTLESKEPDEKPTEKITEDFNLKKRKDKKETNEGQVTIKKPKKKKTKTDEVKATVSLKPETEIPTEDINQDIAVKKRKEVKFAEVDTAETIKVKEKLESDNEAEFTVAKRTDEPDTEDIETEVTILKEDTDESNANDVVAEFTVKKKKEPKLLAEEYNDEYTIKKLKKRRRSQVEIPEYTDVEHVTFRPRSTKTKEDVEQEFNIQLDSYAEEEISMSEKVKLKKTKPITYSEEGDEAHINITEKYDDKEGPIIEEIDDDASAAEDTMYDIDEPEEFSDIEELPEHVEFKLKPKKLKASYAVEDLDEEFAVGFTHRRKPDAVSYGEDSFTLRTPSRRLPSSYLEGMQYEIQI